MIPSRPFHALAPLLAVVLTAWVEQGYHLSDCPNLRLHLSQTQPGQLPQGIAGLDVKLGLKRLQGKESLYLTILRKFMAEQRDFTSRFEQAVVDGGVETAERLAHTLKGGAASIGAMDLAAGAAALEAAVRERREAEQLLTLTDVNTPLEALRPVLADLLSALEQHFSGDASQPQRSALVIDADKLKDVCRRLSALLMNDAPSAEDLYAENSELLNTAFQ